MLSFANPWGLVALLAVPAIVAIHLYRHRFPRMAVAGTFLWGDQTQVRDAGRTRDRLPITATLLLELLAAILLAFILAQPRFDGSGRVEHLVVVLDDSASMSAEFGDGTTVRGAALDELEQRVESLGRETVVTIITTGRRPALLAGPMIRWNEANERLADWNPRATDHAPAPAWDLATQLAGNEGRMLFLTDRLPDDDANVPQAMEIAAFGRPTGNVSLSGARRSFDPTTGEGTVSLRVEQTGPSGGPVTLTGTSAGTVVFQQPVDIAESQSTPVEFAVPGGLGELQIQATAPGDALAIDSSVTLVEPKRRIARIAMALPDDHSAIGPLRRVLQRLPAVEFVPDEQADLVITDGSLLPRANPDLWWLGVGMLGDSAAVEPEVEPVDLAGPYVVDKRHRLTSGLTLEGIVWGGVLPVSLTVTPLVSAGPYPLLSRLDGTPTKAFLLNLDLARSNIADSPDWPIFVANLVEAVRDDQPGLRRWNYRSGESIELRLPSTAGQGGATLTLIGPDGQRPIARAQTIEITRPESPGIYELRDGETTVGAFAVNFQDDVESNLTARNSGRHEATGDGTVRGVTPDTLYSWPILAAIACVIAAIVGDWYVLRPKRSRTASHANRRG